MNASAVHAALALTSHNPADGPMAEQLINRRVRRPIDWRGTPMPAKALRVEAKRAPTQAMCHVPQVGGAWARATWHSSGPLAPGGIVVAPLS